MSTGNARGPLAATMTATLDLLEHRGWVRRIPNPDNRRSVLVQITAEGRAGAEPPGPLAGRRNRPARLGS